MSTQQARSRIVVPGAADRRRADWMDVARGIAVLLVILEHALLLTPKALPPALLDLSNVFAPFRVPTLMFLSGLLLPRSLAKPVPQFLWGKASGIVWPYLLWSVLIWGLANWGDDRPNLLRELFVNPTTTPMWFLAYLAMYYVLALFLRGPVAAAAIPLALVAAAWMDVAPASGEAPNGSRFFYLLAFFLAGGLVAEHADRLLPPMLSRRVAIPCAAIGLGLAVASVAGVVIKYKAAFAVPVFLSIVAALPLIQRLSRTRLGRVFGRYGRQTIIFYVVHWPAQVMAWHVLAVLGVESALVLAAGNVVAGVAAGLLALWATRRIPVTAHLFTLSPARRETGPRA